MDLKTKVVGLELEYRRGAQVVPGRHIVREADSPELFRELFNGGSNGAEPTFGEATLGKASGRPTRYRRDIMKADVENMIGKGMSTQDMAAHYGCSAATMSRKRADWGIPGKRGGNGSNGHGKGKVPARRKPKPMDKAVVAKIVRLRMKDVYPKEIAERLKGGLTSHVVSQTLYDEKKKGNKALARKLASRTGG